MPKVAIVLFSASGSTLELAKSVAVGVTSVPGVTAFLYEISDTHISNSRFRDDKLFSDLEGCDAIVFGSPTYMGGPSAQFKAFADASSDIWCDQPWRNKIAGGFTIGSNLSGDQLACIQYFQTFAFQHGMLWAGLDIPGNHDPNGLNRLGCQSGLVAHSLDGSIDSSDAKTAEYLGRRIAHLSRMVLREYNKRVQAES